MAEEKLLLMMPLHFKLFLKELCIVGFLASSPLQAFDTLFSPCSWVKVVSKHICSCSGYSGGTKNSEYLRRLPVYLKLFLDIFLEVS